ncbi:MAG: flagellar basal body rod protein FlgB [Actinomycetota bacterium]|nr:flagellar basal body rod protein FlgB [Actinomycetota bacterium]
MSLGALDPVGQVLSAALDGVSLNQHAIADNIANVDTPHYRATTVDFQNALRAAVDDGSFTRGTADVRPQSTAETTPVGANGNNVDLSKETLAGMQSQYQYQVLTRAISDRFERVHESLSAS